MQIFVEIFIKNKKIAPESAISVANSAFII